MSSSAWTWREWRKLMFCQRLTMDNLDPCAQYRDPWQQAAGWGQTGHWLIPQLPWCWYSWNNFAMEGQAVADVCVALRSSIPRKKSWHPFLRYGFQFVRHDQIGLTGCGCWIAGKDLWLVKETVVTKLYPGWCLRNCFCRQVSTGPSSHLWWNLYNMSTTFACEWKMSCCPSSSFYPWGSQSKEWGTIGTI